MVPFIFSPIITRIYDPEVYGEYNTFLATVTVLVSISMFRFDFAIFTARKEGERIGLHGLCLLLILASATFSLLIISIVYLFAPGVPSIYWLLPVLLLMAANTQLFNQIFIVNNEFWANGKRKVMQSLTFNLSATGLGFLNANSLSLIIGQAMSHVIVTIYSFRLFAGKLKEARRVSKAELKALSRQFGEFPKKGVMSTALNAFGSQSAIFLIPILFGLGPAGLYGFTVKLLYLPIQFIGRSISDSLFQRLSENITGMKRLFKMTTLSLFGLGIIPFSVLYFFGVDLFNFFFGEKWAEAGAYASILSPFFLVRFVFSPLISFLTVLNKLSIELRFNAIFLTGQLVALVLPYLMGGTVIESLIYTSVFGALAYLYLGFLILRIINQAEK